MIFHYSISSYDLTGSKSVDYSVYMNDYSAYELHVYTKIKYLLYLKLP
jgi:hypothetical protein